VLFVAKHASLEPAFETGLGPELMFTESQIMVAVLLQLIEERIVALPMHAGRRRSRKDWLKAHACWDCRNSLSTRAGAQRSTTLPAVAPSILA
jgi:hypothetical protein